MHADEYQELAGRTLIATPGFTLTGNEVAISRDTLALAVSAGAIADQVKKQLYHRHGLDRIGLLAALDQVRADADMLAMALRREALADEPINDATVFEFWNGLGLIGESIEVISLILEGSADPQSITKELGDALWYIAAICTRHGLRLSDVLMENVAKLKARYPDGYSSAASMQWQATR